MSDPFANTSLAASGMAECWMDVVPSDSTDNIGNSPDGTPRVGIGIRINGTGDGTISIIDRQGEIRNYALPNYQPLQTSVKRVRLTNTSTADASGLSIAVQVAIID